MTTCLEDLNASLQAIQTALEGVEGGQPASVSLEQQAVSQSVSASSSVSIAYAAAVAYAESLAVALNFVDVDVRIDQTTIIQLLLPPVRQSEPPALTDYPSEDTGVTDTPTTTGDTSEACQLAYQYVNGMEAFLTGLGEVSAPLYAISSAVWQYIDLNAKAILALGLRLPLPKGVTAALVSLLVGISNAGGDPSGDCLEAAAYLDSDGAGIICAIIDGIDDDFSTYQISSLVGQAIDLDFPEGGNAAAILKMLFSPSLVAAAMFVPIWGIPSTSVDCGCAA